MDENTNPTTAPGSPPLAQICSSIPEFDPASVFDHYLEELLSAHEAMLSRMDVILSSIENKLPK